MQNKLLTQFFMMLSLAIISYGQNPCWIIGNYSLIEGNLSPLPIPATYTDAAGLYPAAPNDSNDPLDAYDGQVSKGSANGISKIGGDILFFVVDGVIYNGKGEGRGTLPFFTYRFNNQIGQVYGSAETVIVPDPANCNRYYIFSVDGDDNPTPGSNLGSSPYVCLYDAIQEEIVSSRPWFSIVPSSTNGIFNFPTITGSNLDSWVEQYGYGSLAATKKQADGSHYIANQSNMELAIAKVDATGIHPVFLYETLFGNSDRKLRSIMELYEDNISNEKTIVSYQEVYNGASRLLILKLNSTMDYTLSETQVTFLNETTASSAVKIYVKGIEFSPDGRYIYLTHTPNVHHPEKFCYIDLTNPTIIHPITVPASYDLQFSEIELSKDANGNDILVFAHQGGLLSYSNPNSPGTGSFTNIQSFALAPNYSSDYVNNQTISQKYYLLPDQIDGFNYTSFLIENVECCLANSYYHQESFTATANATWTPSSNPLNNNSGSDVYIQDEIRIPAGKTITIQGMNIYFAPGARFVVENGASTTNSGGKLTLDDTKLTVDTRCTENRMWLGVEVWGNQTLTQGWGATSQGTLIMKNNSRIEHAKVGVLLSKRNQAANGDILTYSYNNARDGGIINAFGNSVFFNNETGVLFRPYFGAMAANNLSSFTQVKFEWNGPLKEGVYRDHALLAEVKGIAFKGCEFVNNSLQNYTLSPTGRGINASESQFYVMAYCPNPGPFGSPCTGEIPCTFKNLYYGINAYNANVLSFTCDKNKFIDNRFGIVVYGTKNEKITSNNFAIRESDLFQSVGVSLRTSSGYQVENNEFYEFDNTIVANGQALSFGVVVNNSGTSDNEIYRNIFHNLRIGGQTEGVNAVPITSTNKPELGNYIVDGLRWKCNNFKNSIYEHDLTLMNGSMRYLQGANSGSSAIEIANNVAGNKFSLTGELAADQHDIYVSDFSQRFVYNYIDAPRQKPDSYTFTNTFLGAPQNAVNIDDILWNGNMIIDDSGTCPSKLISKPKAKSETEKIAIKNQIVALENLIDGGNKQDLLNVINTATNEVTKNILLDASPYLSDEVLMAYIAKNPPIDNLKQVVIANSHLTTPVKTALLSVSMPSGIANQIASAQVGNSPRSLLMNQIYDLKSKYNEIYQEQVRDLLLNDSENVTFSELILLLNTESDIETLETLFKMYNLTKDTVLSNLALNKLLASGISTDKSILYKSQTEASQSVSTCSALTTNNSLLSTVNSIRTNGTDEQAVCEAMCMMKTIEEEVIDPEFIMKTNSSHSMTVLNQNNESNSAINLSKDFSVHVYPNPTSGEIFIDYPNLEEGILKIQIIDINGRIVKTFESGSLSNSDVINIESLEKGLYSISLFLNGAYVETQKVILN